MRNLVVALALLAAAGCETVNDDIPANDDPRYTCTTTNLGGLVGQQATQQLGTEALRASNARTIRWIRPGDAVTMDYRSDRLNIRLDAQNRVASFDCG
ncbi:MAG TPA: I78 family peptidase inhibitor [Allosphingosinicella sp.]|jgi:hypothetical protein